MNLLDEHVLRKVLHRERDRSNRTDRPFLILLFSLPHDQWRRRSTASFCKLLDSRLRSTDVYGRFRNDQIAVLLPETPREVAETVGKDVCEAFARSRKIELNYKVHVHPFDQLDDNERADDGDGSGGSAPALPQTRQDTRCTDITSAAPLLIRRCPLWKRSLDILGAAVGLTLSAPILLVAAAVIRLDSKGSAIFRQRRAGIGGRPFTIYKLRTMSMDAESKKASLRPQSEQDGPAFKIKNDPRITRVGSFLRKTSIDELPQLWNVLKGDMSLVGPRPLPCDESDGCDNWQKKRLDVKPGITCIWQVFGRSAVSFVEWMRMDLRYIRYYSLSIDLKLLLRTVLTVLNRKGAS